MSELDGLKLLRRIEEGVAGKTGEAFFRQIVHDLASALNAHSAFSSRLVPGRRASMLAFWVGERFEPCVEYALEGTPCEYVYRGEITSYARNVGDVFPVDRAWFEQLGIKSYLGVPVKSETGEVFGHFAVMDTCERDWRDADVDTLRLFSLRSAAEIERTRYQGELERTNVAFREANERLSSEITQRIAIEDQLAAAKSVAESANQAKSVFISHMSHELRTPLNGILGYAQLLKREIALSPETLRDGLGVIERSGEHLLKLVNDLLDLARVEAGRFELSQDVVDLRELVQHVAKLGHARAAHAGLTFEVDGEAESLVAVSADERVLRQILLNLVGNAVKFTDRGGRVTLRTHCERTPAGRQRVLLAVEDTGIGIAEEQLTRIFEPFHRVTNPERVVEGSGLGLAITQRLIAAMGGKLIVTSEPGVGSTFLVECELEEAPTRLPRAATPAEVVGYSGDPRVVFIVDDDRDNRSLVRQLLESVGFVVHCAANGSEAMRLIRGSSPDLILTDLVMPMMDGIELVRALRGDSDFSAIPVIAMSASASEYTRRDALQAGCSGFISKPLSLTGLLEELGTSLHLEWRRREPAIAPGRNRPNAVLQAFKLNSELAAELYHLAMQGDILSLMSRVDATLSTDAAAETFCTEIRTLAAQYDIRGIRQALASNCSVELTG